jgi:peptidoglycan hydrolase CwlO-like protein
MAKLTNTIIEAAIAGFEAQKKDIDAQIAELRGMLTGTAETPGETAAVAPAIKGRRKFSAAARKRMREAQQARWAKIRAESAPATKTVAKPAVRAAKPKGGVTAAGRKKLSIAMKKRWAAKKAAAA